MLIPVRRCNILLSECSDYPLASILVPVYNSPDVLSTVASVLCQTYKRIELILIDDGSRQFNRPAVKSYISKYRQPNLESATIIINPQNMGTVKALKRAFEKASGCFTFTLAGDDLLYDPDVIKDWIEEFARTGAEVITGRCENYDAELKEHIGTLPSLSARGALKRLAGRELFERFALECLVPGASTAWRTDSLRRYGAFDTPYRLIEDYPLYLRVLRDGGSIHFFDRPVVKHRGGGVSAEENNISKLFEEDSQNIYKQEIFPYTSFPRRVARKHNAWERDVRFDRYYYALRRKYEAKPLILFAIQVVYYAYHPVRAARELLRLLKKGKNYHGN